MSVLIRDALKHYHTSSIDIRIDLDRTIRILKYYNEIDDIDLKIIKYYELQYTPEEIGNMLGHKSRATIHRKIRDISYKMSRMLGISYQDFKIILQVEKKLKRKLTEDEVKFCWFIIRRHGVKTNNKLSIYNFVILRDGKIITKND